MAHSGYTESLIWQCKVAKLPVPQAEVRFHPKRRWRFDLAWAVQKLAAEVEGAVWTRGRHTRGAGYEADCVKYNTAALAGWKVLRFTSGQVKSGYALTVLEQAFRNTS